MNEEEFEKLLQERENRNLELKLGLPEPKKKSPGWSLLFTTAVAGKLFLALNMRQENRSA